MVTLAEGLRAPFPRFWVSGFLADFGDGVRLAAFPLLAVQFTRAPVAVAAVTAVQGLPWLVTGAALGVLVDRTDRRRLVVIVDTVQALVIAALAVAILAHSAGLLLIYLTAFVTGLGAALRGTAASVSVPRLVEPAELDKANGRVIAGQIVGNELAGPAAGGWLFGLAAVLPFALNAGALGIAVLLLLTLPSVFGPQAPRVWADSGIAADLTAPGCRRGRQVALASRRHPGPDRRSGRDQRYGRCLVCRTRPVRYPGPAPAAWRLWPAPGHRRTRRDCDRGVRNAPHPAARSLALPAGRGTGDGRHPGRARTQR